MRLKPGRVVNGMLSQAGCTWEKYCARVHYCYDSYGHQYQCGCYERAARCVPDYDGGSSGSSGGGCGY